MGVLDTLSGKAVEDKVSQYSELYGEVLLGLHRDLQKLGNQLHTEVQTRTETITGIESSLSSLSARLVEAQQQLSVLVGREKKLADMVAEMGARGKRLADALDGQAETTKAVKLYCLIVGAVGLLSVVLWLVR